MKQYMKRVVLVLSMVACLFSLSACSANKAAEAEVMDPQMEAYVQQTSESLLQTIASLDLAAAEMNEAALLKEEGMEGLASGVTSWMGVMEDTGAYVGLISSETELADDGYACTVMAQFEQRNVEFRAVFSEDSQYPTALSFTPEYTTGEKMTKAGMNTLMGMGTVFLVLIFISLLISGFKFIGVFEKKMKEKEAAATAAAAPAAVAAPAAAVPETEENLADDLELVAVITAAIAAATGSSTDGLVVRSIKRAPGAKWKRA